MQQPNAVVLPHYERILYATNGSPSAQKVGKHAVFLAQHSQAQLIVLYVLPNSITHRISFLLRGPIDRERRTAIRVVEEVVSLAAAHGVQAVSSIECGHRNDVIDRAAVKYDVDLIVMSSTGGEDLQQIFGPASSGTVPLWERRPICVIMC